MKINQYFRFPNVILPVTLFAFAGPSVTFLQPVFTTSTRWAIATILVAYLLASGQILRNISGPVGIVALLCVIWSGLTYFWSLVPELTMMKSVAFALVMVSMFSAGMFWIRRTQTKEVMNAFFPIVVLSFAAGFFGWGSETAYNISGGISMYQGLTYNPNMFGMLMAMSVPFLLWRLYLNWRNPQRRWLWLAVFAATIMFALISNSRASFLVIAASCYGLLFGINLRKKFIVLLLGLIAALIVVLISPPITETMRQKFIYKQAIASNTGILETRLRTWQESLDFAVQGGFFGSGYGVTIGQVGFEGGLTAMGYGREKGNSQLALLEETGIVGFALYGSFLALLFSRMIRAYRRVSNRDERVLSGLVTGLLVGLVLHSAFEAWWVAPGSPECVYFWAVSGIAMGIERRVSLSARMASLKAIYR